MHSASNTRKYFTQGELFRAHFWSASALNAIYAARPSQPTHDCQPEESSQQCPPIQRRIWPQGKFGAN
jgi:hypothetical protein